jgi:hypothetical protein
MPIDLSGLVEAFRGGFAEIPPIAIALGLLAGPTLALIGYRLVGVATRAGSTTTAEAAPYWVCHDCRSINELRAGRCYHCGLGRDAIQEIEVIIEAPVVAPTFFEAPAGSPFAALGGNVDLASSRGAGPGVPVMQDTSEWSTGVPVGPGHASHAVAVPVVAEGGEALLLADLPAEEGSGDAPLTSVVEREA